MAIAVPVPNHGDEDVSALCTAERTGIAMLGHVAIGGSCFGLQPLLSGVPQLLADDWRKGILMTKTLCRWTAGDVAVVGFGIVVDQYTGIGFLVQDIFHTGVSPEVLSAVRLLGGVDGLAALDFL